MKRIYITHKSMLSDVLSQIKYRFKLADLRSRRAMYPTITGDNIHLFTMANIDYLERLDNKIATLRNSIK